MEPLVSVIVPIYNVPKVLLENCIKSIQQQTLTNIEIILVEDGSPDNCGEICDNYARTDSRIKVIHKENAGLSAARNTGVKSAKGKWITFVDGDDWVEKDSMLNAYRSGESSMVEVVCWGISKYYAGKNIRYKHDVYFQHKKVYEGSECKYMQEMLFQYDACIATAYAKLIRKDFIVKFNIYHDEMLRQGSEGLEFCYRLFENTNRILFLNKHWYRYMYNPNSISSRSSDENNEYVLKCFKKIRGLIEMSDNKDRLLPKFNNRLLYVIITTAVSGYFHPGNDESFIANKDKFVGFIQNEMIKDALESKEISKLDLQRRLVILLIKNKIYLPLKFLGIVRLKQKELI